MEVFMTKETREKINQRSGCKKKDKITKRIEMYNDVFADVFNTLLFKDDVINPDGLKPGINNVLVHSYEDISRIGVNQSAACQLNDNQPDTSQMYMSQPDTNQSDISQMDASQDDMESDGFDITNFNDNLYDKEGFRDVCKIYEDKALSIVSLGIENQTVKDNLMPLRIMMYDCGEYLAQVANLESKKLPYLNGAITVVLNFSNRRWIKPRRLKECIRYDKRLEPFISDYKIHVIDMNFLSDEEIENLSSDLSGILRVLKDVREDKFEPERYKFSFKHQEEAYRFISTYLEDNRFIRAIEELKDNNSEKEGIGENTMCEALDKLINEGEKRGIELGTSQTLFRLVDSNNITVDVAAKDMGVTKEQFLTEMKAAGYKIPE